MIQKATLIIVLLACQLFANAQEADTVHSNDPFDLMTEYFEHGFRPFHKGVWFTGLSFSLSKQSLENSTRLLDKVLTGEDNSFNMTFKGGYYFRDYVMAGVNVTLLQDAFDGLVVANADTITRKYIKRSTEINPVLKTSIPLSKNNRLSLFNEIGFGFSFGNSLQNDVKKSDEITRRYADEFGLSIGLSPGITFFAIENFAFEVQLRNLLGYNYSQSKRTVNGGDLATVKNHEVNFNINLLSLQLGLAYYIKAK